MIVVKKNPVPIYEVICPNCNTTQNIQLIYNKGFVNNGKH